ncbi:Sporulation kinase E [Limihaloglobus sulfuriphilus]|uniref:histidine kinase n=1 Tax=Limihaloglobus sulfuriphilus TaxID=1851148 RepID=A0A1Q2MGL4_9BACT|nr:HAMP domain-containing sensor histidine kinase [Limihaloglobus sulfuriphilus]AQQ71820.1 Sporulation kinase E [Limihaloglobus sulfuriphilus]
MKVTLKFVIVLIVVLFAIRTFEGFLTVKRETKRLNTDIQRDALLLKNIITASVQSTWVSNGREQAIKLTDKFNMDEHPIHISWKPFEGHDGLNSQFDEGTLNKLKNGETVSLRQQRSKRGKVQYFFIPLDIPQADGVIQLAETLNERSRYLQNAWTREAIAGSMAFSLSGAVMFLLGFAIIGRPLNKLQDRIKGIGEGDMESRLVLRGHDELTALAGCLNDMCTKLHTAWQREITETKKRIAIMEQMRHMDRLTTIGRLASGVAHELGTPLNVISGRAGMIKDRVEILKNEQIQDNAEKIKLQAMRMTNIIRHLLDFARQTPPKRVKTNGGDVVRQAVELVNCLGYKANARMKLPQDTSSLVVDIDPVQIQQVATNLIENALQAMPEGGNVFVTVKSVPASPPEGVESHKGHFLQITVKDHGIGISDEYLDKIFDPFFTTKEVGNGTGLGLSITYGIVREHSGWIDVMSEEGKGSCFTVYIPQEFL